MRSRKPIGRKSKSPSSKVRKPVPPPTKVEEAATTYRRAHERERLRREKEDGDAWEFPISYIFSLDKERGRKVRLPCEMRDDSRARRNSNETGLNRPC